MQQILSLLHGLKFNMRSTPLISVVLPVYNAAAFVGEAISSVLCQSFGDFELLIINDGSSDGSDNVIKSFVDERIRYVNNSENKGLVYSLNLGIDLSKAKYLIRMDADDVCLADRFFRQFNFMEENPDVVVSGGQLVDYENIRIASKVVTEPDKLKALLLFSCVLSHPTVIIRNAVIKSQCLYYNSEFVHAEDYELWSRISRNYKIANIPDVLLRYRFHSLQVSSLFSEEQFNGMKKCQKLQLEYIGVLFSEEELMLHSNISRLNIEYSVDFFKASSDWLLKLYDSQKMRDNYGKKALSKVIGELYYMIVGELINSKIPIKKNILFLPLTYRCLGFSNWFKIMVKLVVK